jgi:hypothetical protein
MNLYPHEIKPMLADYVRETGVEMNIEEMSYALFYYTSGYPFLVSRVCKILDEIVMPLKNVQSWTLADLALAVNRVVKEHNTNFDSQIKNLENHPDLYELIYQIAIDNESRMFNIHNPVAHLALIYGLLTEREGKFAIHNRIYNEMIINYMTSKLETSSIKSRWDRDGYYRLDDNALNMNEILLGFQRFMKGEYSGKERDFLEKNARLVFLAFLKPIINGAGYDFKEPQISDEKRLDVVITYYEHRYVAELKIWRGEQAHQKGLLQLANYLDSLSLDTGYLIIFDHKKVKNWASETVAAHGKNLFIVWV